ncbi:MAG: mucoidy inhibitor MuiA family protein [Chitinophagaceae bacterium]|nr:MAG: mucoidy inhibitor MuiA family protein [Chitinophagaceae bacterium]
MKKIFTLASLVCILQPAFSQKDTVTAKASLVHARVYHSYGAELEHKAKATFIKGIQILIVDDVALQPDLATLQVNCGDNVSILSWQHRVFYKPAVVQPTRKEHDSIPLLQKEINATENEIGIGEDMIRRVSMLIENNFTTPDKKNISSEEIVKLTEYYTRKIADTKRSVYSLQLKRNNLQLLLSQVRLRYQETPVEATDEDNQPKGQLILAIMSDVAGPSNIGVSYYTAKAGWVPAYDMRIKSLDNTFSLVYKATVSQTTGLVWNNTNISLATQNPARTSGMPMLNPVYLREYVPQLYSVMEKSMATKGLPQLDATKQVEESTIVPANVSAYTTLSESMLNINYDINLPYTIPSDGKPYNITVMEKPVSARFAHFSVPKIDRNVHFVANIARWDSLNLLPGDANIVLDNTYIGKTFINPAQATDTMVLSLGSDKRISVTREVVKELTTTQVKDETKTSTYVYEIVVRNNKKQKVNVKLQDQYPLTKEKDVEVKLLRNGGASVEEETGFLSWQLDLEPGEVRKIRFSYQVKHNAAKKIAEYR